jgi:hypothetical protein
MRFITIEYIPYEGQDVAWFDTEEEAIRYAKDNGHIDVYEIAREIKYEGNE